MPSIRIHEFDTWRPGYGFAIVTVLRAGTSVEADIYSDEALTVPVANPVTLEEKTDTGISYGKFQQPIYVGEPYQLQINSIDETGITRPPLTTLDDQDASLATVKVEGGSQDIALNDHLARRIDVQDYGEFKAVGEVGASASTNNATLTSALGVGGTRGGAFVELPAGTFQITSYTIPQGVVVRGAGRAATTLQSAFAGNVTIIGGARAGLSRLTLDGVTLIGLSVGVYAANKDQVVFDDVEIKRFETGLNRKGGSLSNWRELYISNCVNGYKGHGDLASALGAALQFNQWTGGKIELCSTVGIDLKNVDAACEHNLLRGVFLDSNTGDAVRVTGARATTFEDCRWAGNTNNLVVADTTPATPDNTVIGLEIKGGSIDGGTMSLSGTLEQVALRRVDLKDLAVTLTTPSHNVLVEDCREISGVSLVGTATAWTRHKTGDRGSSSGITTGAVATKAWAIALAPGQQVYLEGKVVGRQRNGIGTAFYHLGVSAGRPGATLNYDTQTANFTLGNVLTGATSGATARITADTDAGTTGALTLQDVVGVFVDNEIITDSGGGSAMANGALSFTNAALVGSVAAIRAAQETVAGWDATFVANGPEIELRVTGAASTTIEWTPDVDVVSS